jgi:hypothetical protein
MDSLPGNRFLSDMLPFWRRFNQQLHGNMKILFLGSLMDIYTLETFKTLINLQEDAMTKLF